MEDQEKPPQSEAVFSGAEVAERAERAKLETDPLGDFQTLLLRKGESGRGEVMQVIKPGTAEAQPFQLEGEYTPGTYSENNGVFIVVEQDGSVRTALGTKEQQRALAGFERKDMNVPFSNGETPISIMGSERWRQLHYQKAAAEAGVEPSSEEPKGDWVQIDENTVFVDGAGGDVHQDKADPWEVPDLKEAGHYAVNNNVVGFRDSLGRHYEGPASKENLAWVSSHGYANGNVNVRISNRQISDKWVGSKEKRKAFDEMWRRFQEEAAT